MSKNWFWHLRSGVAKMKGTPEQPDELVVCPALVDKIRQASADNPAGAERAILLKITADPTYTEHMIGLKLGGRIVGVIDLRKAPR